MDDIRLLEALCLVAKSPSEQEKSLSKGKNDFIA